MNGPLKVTVDATAYKIEESLKDPEIDESARQILFAEKAFEKELVVKDSKQKLTITIEGLANPYKNEASSSFEIVTFARSENVLYFIDMVAEGLIIDSNCDYPCKDC